MKKVLVEICVGTACYVMGASELISIQDSYSSSDMQEMIEFRGTNCLDVCMHNNCGKTPFVRINGEVLSSVTVDSLKTIIDQKLREII